MEKPRSTAIAFSYRSVCKEDVAGIFDEASINEFRQNHFLLSLQDHTRWYNWIIVNFFFCYKNIKLKLSFNKYCIKM